MVDASYLHWIGSVPLGATIAAFGILGNIISIIVWRRLIKDKLKNNQSTGIYLIVLAVCDAGVCLFFLLADTVKTDNPHLGNNHAYAAFFAWFAFPMFFFFIVASIWMVVCVTLNRYLMIRFPTKVRNIYSGWRTYGIMTLFLGFAFIVNVPHFFTFHVSETNGTHSMVLSDYGSTKGSLMYEFWVHCIFLVLAPWSSIAVLNGLIVHKLSKQMKKFKTTPATTSKDNLDVPQNPKPSSKSSKIERREIEMTRMLLSVTFTFLLFLLWQCLTQCFWMQGFNKDRQDVSMSWHYVDSSQAFAKLGVVLNSSVNWVLYCISGTTFRNEMKVWLGGVAGVRVPSDYSTASSSRVTLKTERSSVSTMGQKNVTYHQDESV